MKSGTTSLENQMPHLGTAFQAPHYAFVEDNICVVFFPAWM